MVKNARLTILQCVLSVASCVGASGRSIGRRTLNPRTHKRGKLPSVFIFTKAMHRVVGGMDKISR